MGVGVAQLLSKRALGYLSWRRKRRHRHTQEMLEATTAAALAEQPDALVLTGDLLHIGLRQEMRQIKPWLQRLTDTLPVLLVPGNHDYYSSDSMANWQTVLGGLPIFGTPCDPQHEWPRVLTVGSVQVIGLSTAYPAPLNKADGRLGEPQRARLSTHLQATQSTDTQHTLIALHHPAEPALSKTRKSLLDAAALKTLLPKASALVHGHLHENISYEVNGVPCFCTASASSVYAKALASFRLLEFGATANAAPKNRLFVAERGSAAADFNEQ